MSSDRARETGPALPLVYHSGSPETFVDLSTPPVGQERSCRGTVRKVCACGVKQTFRALSRRSFKPRHATGRPLDPKIFQAHLEARYLAEG